MYYVRFSIVSYMVKHHHSYRRPTKKFIFTNISHHVLQLYTLLLFHYSKFKMIFLFLTKKTYQCTWNVKFVSTRGNKVATKFCDNKIEICALQETHKCQTNGIGAPKNSREKEKLLILI